MTSKVAEELPWLSKKPTSCLNTDLRYSIRIRDVCLSAVLVQHTPSARAVNIHQDNQYYIPNIRTHSKRLATAIIEEQIRTQKRRDSDSKSDIEQPNGILQI